MADSFHRRDFLKLVTITSGGALAACSPAQPQKLVPYVVPPDDIVPGVATWYKSVCRDCPAGCGTLVRTREGRAVKVEGNPDHPVNRGALCVRGQAALQGLYNPDRLAQPLARGEEGALEPITWEQAEERLATVLRYLRYTRRAGRIALVSERVTGSMDRLLRDWLAAVGSGRFLMYEPFAYEALRAANRITFGTPEIPHYDISRANVLISFGADFLETWLSNVEFARQFAEFRPRHGRFIHVGPRLSLTAANADEWIPALPDKARFFALALLREILGASLARIPRAEADRISTLVAGFDPSDAPILTAGLPIEKVRKLAREFATARPGLALGPGLASSNEHATALSVAVNLLNYVCGNVGETVEFGCGASWEGVATHREMLDLAAEMRREQVEAVIFHHTNPAYALPDAVGFRAALARVPFKVSFTPVLDETAALCDLVLPSHTPLERWEDYSPRAGIFGLAQPVMQPGFHFDSRHPGDVLLEVSRKADAELAKKFPAANFYEYLRDDWRALHRQFAPQKPFEESWRGAVAAGGVWWDVPAKNVRLSDAVFRFEFPKPRIEKRLLTLQEANRALEEASKALHLAVYPRGELFDGRGANRPWLQETPDAMTKITWDSWAEIHPETAKRFGVGEGDLLKVNSPYGSIQIPAHVYEGIRAGCIAIPLGQGHTVFGRWAEGRGPSPLKLLAAETEAASGGLLWSGATVTIERLEVNRPLARTQIETRQNPDGRERGIAQAVPLSELLEEKIKREAHEELSIYPAHAHPEHRWGMAIDLNACVGCNACIVACAMENNSPWVGKEQVARGRHMAWMRIDRYFEEGRVAGVEARFLPMLCQQCDNAPCESVCPVYATYHNHEGLNVQVFNRCVGTRYCANNCPYSVRRFNWFDWERPWPMPLTLNPDVSARSKGVMEKCTFCVQRIREGKDHAKDEGRVPRDGEITPACAQTCPANAIVFGDLNDASSRVAQFARDPRGYHVLGELNTRPAITYLKKIVREEKG